VTSGESPEGVEVRLPNFYFHLTTAYDTVRSAGAEIGKRDFLGGLPGASRT